MMQIEIKGVKEFESQLQKMALNTSKSIPEFLHQQGQMFLAQLASDLKKEAPTISEIDSDVFGSLDNGGGIRVNRRNWKKAERLMAAYRENADAQIKALEARRLKGKRELKRLRDLETARKNRNMVAVKTVGHHRQLSFYKATKEIKSRKKELEKLGVEIANRHRAMGVRVRLNLPALAARFEINRRHSGAGGMAAEIWGFYKKLRAYPLGSPFAFALESKDKWSWKDQAKMVRGQNILNLAMTSPGFRPNKTHNLEILSNSLRARTDDMKSHLEKKLQGVFK